MFGKYDPLLDFVYLTLIVLLKMVDLFEVVIASKRLKRLLHKDGIQGKRHSSTNFFGINCSTLVIKDLVLEAQLKFLNNRLLECVEPKRAKTLEIKETTASCLYIQ